jgi:threonine dehydrogenase-like Zn-dependent dehydrogenase
MKGYMGFKGVVGHEFVGLVETAPAGKEHLIGKRVVGDINLICPDQATACFTCQCGGARARNHCTTRTVLGILNKDGTYQERLTLPAANLHVVPDNVTTENAAFAEPLAAAFRIPEQQLIAPGDKIAIVGDGKLGLLIAEVLGRHAAKLSLEASSGAGTPKPILFGRHADKMALLSSAAGVETRASEAALPDHAAKFDVVVDATGSPAGLDLARALCRPLGTLILKSTCAAGTDFNTAPFVVDELRIIGSRCGPFPPALELLASGLDLTNLITATYPLSEVGEAIKKAGTKGTMKVQLRVSE